MTSLQLVGPGEADGKKMGKAGQSQGIPINMICYCPISDCWNCSG